MKDISNHQHNKVKSREKDFESRFEAIARTASDAIIITDENSIIVFANKKAKMVFGYDEGELTGKCLVNLLSEKNRNEHTEGVKKYIQTGDPSIIGHVIEMEGIKKDGSIFPIELSLSSWKEDGKYFFSGIMRDITERIQNFEEINHLNKKLKEQQLELEAANAELSSLNEALHSLNLELNDNRDELQDVLDKLNLLNNKLEERIEERTIELAKSENQLRLITDALPALITYVDADQKYRFNNLAYEKWFNVSRKEVYGKHIKEVMGEEYYESVEDTIQKVLKGQTVYLETKLEHHDTGTKYVSVHYIPHIMEGEVLGYYSLINDITEHKQAQKSVLQANEEINLLLSREKSAFAEVKEQQKRLYNLLMQAPSLVAIVRGNDFVFELANPPYVELFGNNSLIEGKKLKEVVPDLDDEVMDIFNNVYKKGERHIGKEVPVMADWKKNGDHYTRYFNMIYEPVREMDDSISGIMTFGYEVTEHVRARHDLEKNAWTMKQMNKALKKKNQDLKKLNIDLDNFIYTASHDLKSPAVNLEGLVMLLKSEFDHKFDYKDKCLIEMIEKSIHKLYKTIYDLTEITKAQKDIDGEMEEVSIREILEDIKADLSSNIKASEAVIYENIHVDCILFNKGNLRSIIYNLLSNAIKYRSSERPLKITISTISENDKVILSLNDNGLGMDEYQLPKLFTMFKRMHTHVEGTGIGLYIIKRIIENNGGKILVESKKNVGTTFKVYFPNAND